MSYWNINSAVDYLQWHAEPSSHQRCARYVREAIQRGGISLMVMYSARNYGSSLICTGFYEVSDANPQKGDVVVIQAIANHPDGHMAMYDGRIWISDFRQQYGFYPGPAYRSARPPYQIYRHD
ncbi:CHAP domain-containing protein [Paraburkholderia phytofirmans]|jgi:CHAP domain.|uniref:CHAP domain-containing protein n=1 Tax=Paraburkholderia phytofirmans TaxID=261302 RepID=A0ABW9BMR9_9BURK